jgi:phosphotriesterase-related protein
MTGDEDRWNRRGAIRLLCGGALGVAVATSFDEDVLVEPLQAAAASRGWPTGAIIRTVLKDVPPDSLSAILFHEHLHISSSHGLQPVNAVVRGQGGPGMPNLTRDATEDFDGMVEELKQAAKDGVGCIVDGGHADMGRRAPYLRQLSKRSGLPIVVSGGYYSSRSYAPEVLAASEDELVEEFVAYATAERWGAMGEIGTSAQIDADERKVVRAVARMHLRTHVPIFTHTENGQAALEQLDLYQSMGVNPHNLVIGHLGSLDDPEVKVHKEVAKRGAYVGFDRVGGSNQDASNVTMIMKMIEAGYADRVLLSADGGASVSSWKARGGPGYARPLTVFAPKLRQAGVSEEIFHQITVENPRRFLAFVPPKK